MKTGIQKGVYRFLLEFIPYLIRGRNDEKKDFLDEGMKGDFEEF